MILRIAALTANLVELSGVKLSKAFLACVLGEVVSGVLGEVVSKRMAGSASQGRVEK